MEWYIAGCIVCAVIASLMIYRRGELDSGLLALTALIVAASWVGVFIFAVVSVQIFVINRGIHKKVLWRKK